MILMLTRIGPLMIKYMRGLPQMHTVTDLYCVIRKARRILRGQVMSRGILGMLA